MGPHLFDYRRVSLRNALPYLCGAEGVKRIDRYYIAAALADPGVEAGRAVATPQNAKIQVGFHQGKHGGIFFVRSPPWHDGVE
jgi:hypothetical protein